MTDNNKEIRVFEVHQTELHPSALKCRHLCLIKTFKGEKIEEEYRRWMEELIEGEVTFKTSDYEVHHIYEGEKP